MDRKKRHPRRRWYLFELEIFRWWVSKKRPGNNIFDNRGRHDFEEFYEFIHKHGFVEDSGITFAACFVHPLKTQSDFSSLVRASRRRQANCADAPWC